MLVTPTKLNDLTCFEAERWSFRTNSNTETWQVLKITFWSLQIWKFFWRGYPPDPPYKARAFAILDNAPPSRYKNPSYGPAWMNKMVLSLQQTEKLNWTNNFIIWKGFWSGINVFVIWY